MRHTYHTRGGAENVESKRIEINPRTKERGRGNKLPPPERGQRGKRGEYAGFYAQEESAEEAYLEEQEESAREVFSRAFRLYLKRH